MFGGGFSSSKLKTNLRLCINRLKLLQKKKTELNVKARKEIAGYLAQNKDDRARIKVEHIIRDDYLVEAMECLELYCDLLLARIGLIETQKFCDDGLATPVCTLIWVAPRMQNDIAEFKAIADLLSHKFGKDFAQQARNNTNGAVDPRIKNKITLQQPSPALVEQYLIEIASAHNIPFEPKQEYLMGEDYLGSHPDHHGGGGMPTGSIPPAPGFQGFGDLMSGPPQMDPPPLPQNLAYSDNTSQGISNIYNSGMPGSTTVPAGKSAGLPQPPGAVSAPPASFKPPPPAANNLPQPPSHGAPPANAPPSYNDSFELPNLPSVPSGSFPPTDNNDDVDFDDLNRRFEELKKRK
ncbi:hypothetical protein ACHWQZ_G008216 [Mnemiopsis leidyi]